jgi:flavodoxin
MPVIKDCITYYKKEKKMAKIGLFYGTQTGYPQTAAEMIQQEFGGDATVELYDISKTEPSDFEGYDCIIIGCPTWNVGELQSDWEDFYDELDNIDFSGKKIAYFGEGDLMSANIVPTNAWAVCQNVPVFADTALKFAGRSQVL